MKHTRVIEVLQGLSGTLPVRFEWLPSQTLVNRCADELAVFAIAHAGELLMAANEAGDVLLMLFDGTAKGRKFQTDLMALAVTTQTHGDVSLGFAACTGKTGAADEDAVRFVFHQATAMGLDYEEGAMEIVEKTSFSAFVGDAAAPQVKAMQRLNEALCGGTAVITTCTSHHLQHCSEAIGRAADVMMKERLGNSLQEKSTAVDDSAARWMFTEAELPEGANNLFDACVHAMHKCFFGEHAHGLCTKFRTWLKNQRPVQFKFMVACPRIVGSRFLQQTKNVLMCTFVFCGTTCSNTLGTAPSRLAGKRRRTSSCD